VLCSRYQTSCTSSFVGGDYVTSCGFTRLGRLGSNSVAAIATVRADEDPTIIPPTNAQSYPKSVPVYTAASEVGAYVGDTTYSRPGSWCAAAVSLCAC
jgi:hypothetical protein